MSPTEIAAQSPNQPPLDAIPSTERNRPDWAELSSARFQAVTVVIMTLGVLLAVYLLRLDPVVGQFKDDGWYVVLAKSLATGHGYNLINLPQHAGIYFYPPFFPFLLSLIYRAFPQFPQNVPLLKSLSILSMLVLPVLVYRLLRWQNRLPRSLACVVAVAAALAPPFVMLATSSVMSECVFTVLQFGALLAAQRATREEQNKISSYVLLAALLASAAYLTRTIGIAVVAAIALSFLHRKMTRAFAAAVATFALFAGSWTLYTHFSNVVGPKSRPMVAGYSAQFWDRLAGVPGPKVTVRDLPARVWQLSTVMVGDDVGALITPSFYRFGPESGEELVNMTAAIPAVSSNPMRAPASMGLAAAGQLISLGFSIVVVLGFVVAAKRDLGPLELTFLFSLLIIAVWPWSPIRLMLPLLPLLLYYLVLGIAKVEATILKKFTTRSVNALPWRASRMVMICVLAFFLYDHSLYVMASHKTPSSFEHPDWLRNFNNAQRAATWIHDHTEENEVIAGDNPPLLYLYSGRVTSLCHFDDCANEGIRYFVNTWGGNGVGVVEIQKQDKQEH